VSNFRNHGTELRAAPANADAIFGIKVGSVPWKVFRKTSGCRDLRRNAATAVIVAFAATLALAKIAPAQEITTYTGICEPSGGAFVDATRFVVASDESNVLRIYERGFPDILASVDLTGFLMHEKSDLEGAALGDGMIYWTASQSFSSKSKDGKRMVIFATTISNTDAETPLVPMGVVREDLKDELVAMSGTAAAEINIEGLAAGADGSLYFGFRNLVDREAPVVHLKNTAAVLSDASVLPIFGQTTLLNLGGRGIRSLERIGDRYMVVAGPSGDSDSLGFALYWWDGNNEGEVQIWDNLPPLGDIDPEVAVLSRDGTFIQIVSDDGDRCPKSELEDPASSDRHFQSLDVLLQMVGH